MTAITENFSCHCDQERPPFCINDFDRAYMDAKNAFTRLNVSRSSLDFFDYIPVVSNISGVVRCIFGIGEALIGTALLPIQLIGRVYYISANKESPSFYFNKGIANIIRATVAETFIAGNIALYIYDHSPHLKYDLQHSFGIHN